MAANNGQSDARTTTPQKRRQVVPHGWTRPSIEDVLADWSTGFAIGERSADGVVQLRMNNVAVDGTMNLDEATRVPATPKQAEQYALRRGDVLFNNTNSVDLVGKSAMFRGHAEPVLFSNHFTRLRTDPEKCVPEFLAESLRRMWNARVFAHLAQRWVGQAAVQSDKLLPLPILLPPPAEQAKIAAVLGAVDEAVERSRAVLAQTRALRQALLHILLTRGLPGKHTKFKTVRLGDLYAERSENGIDGLPIMSVTANGLVPRSSVDRRVESELEDEGHALVRKGDLAYNMMRMWQGVSGLADRDCLVSPAYVVCSPKKGLVPEYGALLLKAPHVVRLLHLHSQGVHEDRLRLYLKHFAPIKVEIPDEDAQRVSVRMIATLDARLAAAASHLSQMERVKSALSAALLSGEVRVPVDCLSALATAPTKGKVGHG